MLQCLIPRDTRIAALEALAVLRATVFFSRLLCNRDVLLFIDNQAVAAALVRGSSPADDISIIVSATHLLWARLACRAWIEWVPSV